MVSEFVTADTQFWMRWRPWTPRRGETFASTALWGDRHRHLLDPAPHEHALHNWDVRVALDPTATLPPGCGADPARRAAAHAGSAFALGDKPAAGHMLIEVTDRNAPWSSLSTVVPTWHPGSGTRRDNRALAIRGSRCCA